MCFCFGKVSEYISTALFTDPSLALEVIWSYTFILSKTVSCHHSYDEWQPVMGIFFQILVENNVLFRLVTSVNGLEMYSLTWWWLQIHNIWNVVLQEQWKIKWKMVYIIPLIFTSINELLHCVGPPFTNCD